MNAKFPYSMLPILALLLLLVFVGTECSTHCSETLQEVGLAPEYTDNIPLGDLQLVYEVGNETYRAKCGDSLSISKTLNQPNVTVDLGDKCENGTIIFFDPDPIPVFNLGFIPVFDDVTFLHWFVTDIPADVLKKGYLGQVGNVWAEYYGPLGFTGEHRYTFCVYCQTRSIAEHRTYKGIPPRFGVDPRDLVAETDLLPPEACNFYYAVLTESPRLGK